MLDRLTTAAKIKLFNFARGHYANPLGCYADVELDWVGAPRKRATTCPLCGGKIAPQDTDATAVIFRFAMTPATARVVHDRCLAD